LSLLSILLTTINTNVKYSYISFKGRDKAWVEDPPERILYKSQYSGATQEEQGAGTYIFIALCCVFVAAVIGCIYEVWRSARKDRQRRRSAASATPATAAVASGSQRWQPQQYTESLVTGPNVKTVGFKNVTDDDKRPNGTHMKVPSAKEYKPLPNAEPKDLTNDKKVHIKGTRNLFLFVDRSKRKLILRNRTFFNFICILIYNSPQKLGTIYFVVY